MNYNELLAFLKPKLRELIREELLAIFSAPAPTGLLKPKNAIAHLDYEDVNELYADITAGLLRPNKEVFDRRRPGSNKARWVVDVEACRRRYAENPDDRTVA